MGILGDLFSVGSSIVGAKSEKKQNKVTKAQLEEVKKLVEQLTGQTGLQNDVAEQLIERVGSFDEQAGGQNEIGDYLLSLAEALQKQGGGYTDAFGGGVEYNPDTGQYIQRLSPEEKALQEQTYKEQGLRNGIDQTQRRLALQDVERVRKQASGEEQQSVRDLANLRAGRGTVDPTSLASTMRLNRTKAVNAGYDDAANAAGTISLRTGASAGDALSRIARNRTKDIATQLGDPETEALTLAEQINSNRMGQATDRYNMFSSKASNVYDAGFDPSTSTADNTANMFKTQVSDLARADQVGSFATAGSAAKGAGTQALGAGTATLGGASDAFGGGSSALASAIQGLIGGNAAYQTNTNKNITGRMLQGVGNGADSLAASLAKIFAGGA